MWTPLHAHSHHSLLDGLAKASQIVDRCVELGYTSCALTDHGSISGSIDFITECEKKGIKPIVGIECYVTTAHASVKEKDNKVSHQIILAKNYQGWLKLIQLVSRSNNKENFYYKPRIDVQTMVELCDSNLISFSGHFGSTLQSIIDDTEWAINYVRVMKSIFGESNFFIEIQRIDPQRFPDVIQLSEKLRELARITNTKTIATGDSHYARKTDAVDHRVLLCSSLQLTLRDIKNKKDVPLDAFFKSDCFHIPSTEELLLWGNTEEEIRNTQLIADCCEVYKVTGPPRLPNFECPEGVGENDYLRQLCRDGWKKKIRPEWDKKEYADRVKYELGVIDEAKLAGYFLIVQDYVNWAKGRGWLVGPGRGSAAGCLVAYLLNITNIDPIKYGLLFSRFYNRGRNTPDHISLPDIDVDFPITKRKFVIDYLREKYGKDRVCQMATFGRLQGRGAIKEVLRVNNVCDFETMNMITKDIPQEAEINDQMEESGETSILRWTLQNDPKVLADWCKVDENGVLTGEYAEFFAQAIRLEGTYKSQGKHAAGVLIAAEPLDRICPMINDKNSDEKIAGMAMGDLESMGHVKLDILGLLALDRLYSVNNLLQTGKVERDDNAI
jgi:DNA polymerase-3 subunit alpha